MKKLYTKGKKIYPSPPPSISDHLSLLPAAILTLTITLSTSDKEVLAYLISCSGNPKSAGKSCGSNGDHPPSAGKSCGSNGDHPPSFHCDCFRCYMSYWVRWDTSPNQEVIHKIIDAYEDSIFEKKSSKVKKERKKRNNPSLRVEKGESGESGESNSFAVSSLGGIGGGGVENGGDCEVGSVKKIMSFLGERIWGVWGI